MTAIPFDREPRHTGLLSKDIPLNAINLRLRGRLSVHFLIVVKIVDVVSDTDELSAIVAACEEDDCDA